MLLRTLFSERFRCAADDRGDPDPRDSPRFVAAPSAATMRHTAIDAASGPGGGHRTEEAWDIERSPS